MWEHRYISEPNITVEGKKIKKFKTILLTKDIYICEVKKEILNLEEKLVY